MSFQGRIMNFETASNELQICSARRAMNRAEFDMLLAHAQEAPKKQGKEKKPDKNLVSLVIPGA